MSTPMTYEEACALQKSLWSPERLRVEVLEGTEDNEQERDARLERFREENRQRLFEVGWTSEALVEEARRRMHARIAEMKAEEEDGHVR